MNTIYKIISTGIIFFLIVLSVVYFQVFKKVDAGSYPIIVTVEDGEGLYAISDKLKANNIINNTIVFEAFVKTLKQDTQIKKGEYTFKKPLNIIEITDKLANARYEYDPVIVTITEGENSRTIIDKIYPNFKNVSSVYTVEEVMAKLEAKEGYLFPETYNYAPFATLEDIFAKVDAEFNDRIVKYAIPANELQKILTIASILEREVPNPADMKIVAGIIYNRLNINMPLQMDSTLGYVTDKASLQLTTEDLKNDSPYNTYQVKGLPPGPIGNPGDYAIDAALHPDTHDYLFFLSDKDGVNHYTKSYDEHLKNRKTYLGK